MNIETFSKYICLSSTVTIMGQLVWRSHFLSVSHPFLAFLPLISIPLSSDGLAEHSGGGGEGDPRVQVPPVPVLPALQRVTGGEDPAGRGPSPSAHRQERPPPTD